MSDRYTADRVDTQARRLVAITPHDSTNLTEIPKALWVGGGGTLSILAVDSAAAVSLTGVAPGTLLPLRVLRVNATGTTAAGLVGFY